MISLGLLVTRHRVPPPGAPPSWGDPRGDDPRGRVRVCPASGAPSSRLARSALLGLILEVSHLHLFRTWPVSQIVVTGGVALSTSDTPETRRIAYPRITDEACDRTH